MKIQTIRLQHFKGIEDLTIQLSGKSTVLFGINGAGKSSLLRGVALVYANLIAKLTASKKLAEFHADDISYGKSAALVSIVFSFPDGCEIACGCTLKKAGAKRGGTQGLKELAAAFETRYMEKGYEDENSNWIEAEDEKNMPIFVNYGVNRLVLDVPVQASNKHRFTKLSAFDRAMESKIDFRNLFQWFRNQEDIENQEKVRTSPDYEDRSLFAVKKAMLSMLEGFEDIHIDRHPLAMKVKKDGKYLKLNQLSDGEKCTIALFGDLARRMALANPNLPNPLEGQGVVLIDELDLHMHTSWQRKVAGVLRRTFPNIQFLITTHSPQILGELDDTCNLFYMLRQNGQVRLKPYRSFLGWDANVILEEVMGTASVHSRVKELLTEMYACIEGGDFERAEEIADYVDELSGGYADGVAKARVLISRGKRKARGV